MSEAGLKTSAEDLQWLRLLDIERTTEIPAFNRSRLIALRLVEVRGGHLSITDKGRKLLTAH